MTGCEMVVKKGNTWALMKVSHDGMEIPDIARGLVPTINENTTPHEFGVTALMAFCASVYQDAGEAFIEAYAPEQKLGACVFTDTLAQVETPEDALSDLEYCAQIAGLPEDLENLFLCSYSDYFVFVDLDAKTVKASDEEDEDAE
jgi:hypothetical protein